MHAGVPAQVEAHGKTWSALKLARRLEMTGLIEKMLAAGAKPEECDGGSDSGSGSD